MGNFESNETNLAATGKFLQFGIEETISKYPYSASRYPFRKTELKDVHPEEPDFQISIL
jgi:hypothetical protein